MDIFLASIGIFIWELYGTFVGWWSLVTQIVLQDVIGFNIKNAIALDNAAILGWEIWLLIMLLRKNKIEKWMWYIVICASFWAIFWANLLYMIPSEIMKIFFTGAVVWVVIKNLIPSKDKAYKSDFDASHKSLLFLCFACFFIWIYNSFLSIWDFIIGLLILTWFFHFKYHKALFILSFGFVFWRAIWTLEYFRLWLIDIDFYVPMFFATLMSWLLWWYFVEKIHSDTLTKILKYLSIFLAWYLVFQLF